MSEDVNVGTPQADATPSAPAAAPATPSAPALATPATPSVAPAPGGAPAVEPSWLKGRLEETRAAALRHAQSEYARKEADYQARLDTYQNQLRALVGATPPANPEVDAIKQQFSGLYPGLSKLEQRAQQLEQLLERAGDIESQTDHYWQSYGRQTMDRVFTKVSEVLGTPLNDAGKRQLHTAFTGYVQSSPELTQRYTSDPSIVEDFVRDFTSNFIDPVRRAGAAATATRAGLATSLPQDAPGGAPRIAPPAGPSNMDERVAQGWALYNNKANT
jgi:hypothetical protein